MVGQGSLIGHESYLAVGREITYGVYTTCTAGLNFLSAAFKSIKEVKILEEVQTKRTNSNHIYTGKVVEGDSEFYFSPRIASCNYLLQNAFGGGPVSSATATGATAGAAAFSHIIDVANFAATYSSICLNHRKGENTLGKIHQYSGARVNELSFTAELDEALKCSMSIVMQDVTITANDVSGVLDTSNQVPLSFVDGRFSIETTNGFTTSSYWHVQSMECVFSNNLISDTSARRIGSDILQVLPAGLMTTELKCTMRFDTTTAYDAMINNTKLFGELMFEGPTLPGSNIRESLKLNFANLRITDSGDPEIGGPNEVLTSEISFAVLRDGSSTTGYAVRATVTNDTASYA